MYVPVMLKMGVYKRSANGGCPAVRMGQIQWREVRTTTCTNMNFLVRGASGGIRRLWRLLPDGEQFTRVSRPRDVRIDCDRG